MTQPPDGGQLPLFTVQSDRSTAQRMTTATDASRSFSALLDAVERGETFVVTRRRRRVAVIGPATPPRGAATSSNGAAAAEILRAPMPDSRFAADVRAAR
jgi:prevent-host-death family protein